MDTLFTYFYNLEFRRINEYSIFKQLMYIDVKLVRASIDNIETRTLILNNFNNLLC